MRRRLSDDGDKNDGDDLRRVLGQLSREERLICIWKRAGFSTREIANHHHRFRFDCWPSTSTGTPNRRVGDVVDSKRFPNLLLGSRENGIYCHDRSSLM
jgi:hypothetical protein